MKKKYVTPTMKSYQMMHMQIHYCPLKIFSISNNYKL